MIKTPRKRCFKIYDMHNLKMEKELFNKGFKRICSVDEAGRGPLAGPVIAACVVVSPDFQVEDELLLVNDSKKLNLSKRLMLYDIITKNFEFGVGSCDHDTIDRINIFQATFLAMKKAISAIKTPVEFVLVDGKFCIPNCSLKQQAVIRGDATVFSLAAASIIAKVTRDKLMYEAHKKYPQYGFDKHKGYGTALHLAKLKEHGSCPIHRKSFAPVKLCSTF